MRQEESVAVIGAGPYGLSVAAHLRARSIDTHVFGEPMGFWRQMPSHMFLKSVPSASSLSDPAGCFTYGQYLTQTRTPPQEPIPLPVFLEYGRWFERHAVAGVDSTLVRTVRRAGRRFELELADGRALDVAQVVMAIGVAPFASIPEFARHLPEALASHSSAHGDFSRWRGRSVAVVGCGQSGLESAALLHEAGASVEIIARRPVAWIGRKLYKLPGPLRRVFYPPSDVGPPGVNWLAALPAVLHRLPEPARDAISRRAVRPAGACWLRSRVEDHVRVSAHTQVTRATPAGDALRLDLSDGTLRVVDHLLLATGFAPDVHRVSCLDPDLVAHLPARNQQPALNQWYESAVPGLYFTGALAGHSFGPICRFVVGAGVCARRITRHVSSHAS